MTNLSNSQNSLRDQIYKAFPSDNIPPGVIALGGDEGSEVESLLEGKRWTEIAVEDLCKEPAVLSFLKPGAFTYYLPAYLTASLTSEYAAEMFVSSIQFHLRLHQKEGDIDITLPQGVALDAYFEYFSDWL